MLISTLDARPASSVVKTFADGIADDHVGYVEGSKSTFSTSSTGASMVMEFFEISLIGEGYRQNLPENLENPERWR
jgi:hypothetical protein